jgi:myxalamid-type polyketide synthase MxaB
MGCRFPGARDLDEFWDLLIEGRDAIKEVPPGRWDIGAVYDPAPGTPGKLNTRWGAFLDRLDLFDASFFGISHREANDMDPQQRLLMEVAWEALENGGLAPDKLAGSKSGVFIGIGGVDYTHLSLRAENHLSRISAYMGTGNSHSIAANRLSYFLDLRGPSVALDTACSSSLVAVHLACQSLWTSECDLALAGGVNVILTPEVSIAFSQAHMLASDGRCKTFDAAADGYVRGEGCGIVVLKRLSDALAARDRVLALVRGSAVNQDGRSNGLTAPNALAQRAAVLAALERSGVAPSQIDYVEAHGTATPLGDPIEMRALAEALAAGRAPGQLCLVGSVKTNIGHLETASGIAGLIKVVLAIQHQEIPAHLNFRNLNPHIQLQDSPLAIATERRPWRPGGKRRFAGVSSYGFGGTNAHVIIEEGPPESVSQNALERSAHLLVLSAKGVNALRQTASRIADRVGSLGPEALPDICFTANTGRTHFPHRLAVPASSPAEFLRKLHAFAEGAESPSVHHGHVQGYRRRKLAFLFTGQGSQYCGMGKRLFDEQPTFRSTLQTCAEIVAPFLDQPLLRVLFPSHGEDSPINSTAYTQPALFAMEYALAQLWLSWGIRPDVVLGHSVGEYVAACVAGVFTLEDGLRLVAERARLMQTLPRTGVMYSVFCPEQQIAAEIAPYPDLVSIAAVNGPEHTVISGERDVVEKIAAKLCSQGLSCRGLAVSHAFHSPLVEPVLDTFAQAAGRIRFAAPRIPLVSNLTGTLMDDAYTPGPDYWQRHLRATVQFARGMSQLDAIGCNLFLEVGPSPVLLGMGKACLPKKDALWLPSLRQGEDAWRTLLDSLSAIYVHGVPVDWEGFDRDYDRRKIVLPTYPFDRQSCWLESYKNRRYEVFDEPTGNARPTGHPLLGNRLPTAHATFQVQLGAESHVYLGDHVLDGVALLPGSAYVEMGLAGGVAACGGAACRLSEIEFRRAMLLPEGKTKTAEVAVLPDPFGDLSFQVYGREDDAEQETWTLHAVGKIQPLPATATPIEIDAAPDVIRARCSGEIRGADFYSQLREAGFGYGPQFQSVDRIWLGNREALAELCVPDSLEPALSAHQIHPAVLDACFQVLAAAASTETSKRKSASLYVPVSIKRFELWDRPDREFLVHARLAADGEVAPTVLEGDVHLIDTSGRVIGSVLGLRSQRIDREPTIAAEAVDECLSEIQWDPVELKTFEEQSPTRWLIFADQGGRAEAVAERLQARGDTCVLVFAGRQARDAHPNRYYVDPGSSDELPRLIEQLRLDNGRQHYGVVHLWSLDCPEQLTTESLQPAQKLGCLSILHLIHALSTFTWRVAPRLWLVTAGAQEVGPTDTVSVAQSPLWGLGRTITHELPEFGCTCVDLSATAISDEIALFCDQVRSGDPENQIAFRGRHRYVARMRRRQRSGRLSAGCHRGSALALPHGCAFRVENTAPGSLDGLALGPSSRRKLAPLEVEIEVKAAGLNFRDVMKAMGIYPTAGDHLAWLGDECAGTIAEVGNCVREFRPGDEVIAIGPACFSSYMNTLSALVVSKPAALTFEEAATIPVAFTTAHYGLHHLARLAPGERVLIHAAAGGVGLAAVQIAQGREAEIFATAGSLQKREFLRSLGVKHVFDSRTLTFAAEILDVTGGKGVDVILNSLSGEAIPKSLAILSPCGRFVEIGKRDIYQDSKLGLWPFRKNLSFFAVDMERLFQERPDFAKSLLREVMHHFEEGRFKPLPFKEFSVTNAASAFRYMAQAKQIGKVVLSFAEPPSTEPRAPSLPKLRDDATYLVTGGLGNLGLASAAWMVKQGARNVILAGRTRAADSAEEAIDSMRAAGANVRVVAADVAEEEQVVKLLNEIAQNMPPLKGIIHAAGVLDDGFLLQLTAERFDKVWRPKVMGAWNLHIHTLDAALDFFVLFSSAAAILGSPGQGNYAAANAFLDGLAHYRHSVGQAALSVNWGPWARGGMAARVAGRGTALGVMASIDPEQAFGILGTLLMDNLAQVGVMRFNWDSLRRVYPALADSALLADLSQTGAQSAEFTKASPFVEKILAAPAEGRGEMISSFLQNEVAGILQIEASRVSVQEPLLNLGLDSLMGIELYNRIETELKVTLPRVGFVQAPSIAHLSLRILELLATVGSSPSGAANQARSRHLPVQQQHGQTGLQEQPF